MSHPGYWIECIPVSANGNEPLADLQNAKDLYAASIDGFPDLNEVAPSPDQAIGRLRQRLRKIREHYKEEGRLLPETHNPVRPPARNRKVQGWMSVFIEWDDTSAS